MTQHAETSAIFLFLLSLFFVIGSSGVVIGQTEPRANEKTESVEETKSISPPDTLTNSIGMKLKLIPPGEFLMGSPESAEQLSKAFGPSGVPPLIFKSELPQHKVRITKSFYLGVYEVTRGQFSQFVEATGYLTSAEQALVRRDSDFPPKSGALRLCWKNPGFEQTNEHPVVHMSWNDAAAFCVWLSRKECRQYRLPTEAQWEYACRAGSTSRYCNGNDPEKLTEVGNVSDASHKRLFPDMKAISADDGYVFTSPVGKFKPNAFGLYDMHGNAWEWCDDVFDESYYARSPVENPPGADPKSVFLAFVLRGSAWSRPACTARSSDRISNKPDAWNNDFGFRVLCVQGP
jgi:formylglycine-generating enzyme required for sulfatase activity